MQHFQSLIVTRKYNNSKYEISKQLWVRSAVVERECNSQSLAQGLRENELYYRPVSCNKDFNKHRSQTTRHCKQRRFSSQQQGLGGFQAGLGQTQQQATGNRYSTFRNIGRIEPSATQAGLDATREAARQATFLPQEQLDRFAGQVTGIIGGYPAQTVSTNQLPNPTPLQTALGVGTTLAGKSTTIMVQQRSHYASS